MTDEKISREIHSIDREKDLDASISANRIKDIAKALGNNEEICVHNIKIINN